MEGSLVAYKVFTNGSVLNASEMNEYLMNQSVITFSNSTARSSAITSPVEGMITYLEDTQTYESWNGSAWIRIISESTGNAIINGAFEINQRNFTSTTAGGYGFDRWTWNQSGATGTYSSETFTPGAAPLAGYEATNFARLAITTGNDFTNIAQRIEDVRSFANQTITVSFFAKGTNPTTENGLNAVVTQLFGSGGSAAVQTILPKFTLTGSWQRFSFTTDIASVSGKTIGGGSSLNIGIGQGSSASTDSFTLDLWGVQVEAGSVATPFKRNANSLQGELAACQRYYQRQSAVAAGSQRKDIPGLFTTTTSFSGKVYTIGTMRVSPSVSISGNFRFLPSGSPATIGSLFNIAPDGFIITATGITTTANSAWFIQANDSFNTIIEMSSEL
jgi:hypothetical protein